MSKRPEGFALLATLWVTIILAAVLLPLASLVREGTDASRNRAALAAAWWRADGCLEHLRFALTDTAAVDPVVAAGLHQFDRLGLLCDVRVRPAGTGLWLGLRESISLDRALASLGYPESERAAMIADLTALADSSRRADDVEPSALADPRALLQLVSWRDAYDAMELFEDESSGVISLEHAPIAVLSALPGFSDDVLRSVHALRVEGRRVRTMSELLALLPEPAAATLLPHLSELGSLIQTRGDAWNVVVAVEPEGTRTRLVIRAQIVRSGARVAVVSRRSAIE